MRDFEDTFYSNFTESYEGYSGESVEYMGDVVSFSYRGGGAGQSCSDLRYFKLDLDNLKNILDYYGDDELYITRDFETLNHFIGALYNMLDDNIIWFSEDTKVLIENINEDLKGIEFFIGDLIKDIQKISDIEVGAMALNLVDNDTLNNFFSDFLYKDIERLEKNLEKLVENLNAIIESEEFEEEEDEEG